MNITIKSNQNETYPNNSPSPSPKTSKWQDYPQKISVLVLFIITVIFNVLSSIGTVGKTQTELSGKYTTFLTPPGYTFSIWGLIYTFWALLVICQMAPNKYLSNPKMFYAKSFRGIFNFKYFMIYYDILNLIIFLKILFKIILIL